jgi:uncharacterized iron-regulated protein
MKWRLVRRALAATGASLACVSAPLHVVHAQRPLPATAQPAVAPSVVPANALYVPHRVARGKSWTDFESMLQQLAKADAVFLGEQHDDRGTHALQLAVLEGLARRNVQVVLALEMFERDVQPTLDAYLAGTMPESAFLAQSRPWPNYGPDYRPLVEFAKQKGWPVIASNVPRTLASMVSRGGLSTLDTLNANSQPWVAADRQCGPGGKYAKKFGKTMEDMGGHGSAAMPPEMIGRFYEAQCVKDETMAESIVRAFDRYPNAMVVHVAGGFHVEEGLGTVERVERRVKQGATTRKVSDFSVVMFVPTADLDSPKAGAQRHLGDYVVYPIR